MLIVRSDVIERSINIEGMINAVITQHFFGAIKLEFISTMLYDEYCSFALKRRVLLKIAPELCSIKQELFRMGTIRNYFAHVGQVLTDGPHPEAASRIPDPRNFTKSVNFGNLHKEFLAIEKEILKALFSTYEAKGGKFAA